MSPQATVTMRTGPGVYAHDKCCIAHVNLWGELSYKILQGPKQLEDAAKGNKEHGRGQYADLPAPDSPAWKPATKELLRNPPREVGQAGELVLAFYKPVYGKPDVLIERLGISETERKSHSGVNHPAFYGVDKYIKLSDLEWKPLPTDTAVAPWPLRSTALASVSSILATASVAHLVVATDEDLPMGRIRLSRPLANPMPLENLPKAIGKYTLVADGSRSMVPAGKPRNWVYKDASADDTLGNRKTKLVIADYVDACYVDVSLVLETNGNQISHDVINKRNYGTEQVRHTVLVTALRQTGQIGDKNTVLQVLGTEPVSYGTIERR